jgi:hypothetical protein
VKKEHIMQNTTVKLVNKINRRQFLKKTAVGMVGAGTVFIAGKIVVSPPDMGLPNPYPVVPNRKPAIPPYNNEETLAFNEHQYKLVATLAALIVSADEDMLEPLVRGVVDYVDGLVAAYERKRAIYKKGLKWIDRFSQGKYGSGKDFLNLGINEQIELLRVIDESHVMRYRSVSNILQRIHRKINGIWDDLFGAGKLAYFFQIVRRDVISGYYSNPATWRDIGYFGPPQPNGYPSFSNAPDSANYSGPIRFVDNISCQVCHKEGQHPRGGLIDHTCTTCHRPHSPWSYDQNDFYLEDHVGVIFSNPDRKNGGS